MADRLHRVVRLICLTYEMQNTRDSPRYPFYALEARVGQRVSARADPRAARTCFQQHSGMPARLLK